MFLILINAGSALRAGLLILDMIHDNEKIGENKRKLKNLIIFLVLANSILGFANMLRTTYF